MARPKIVETITFLFAQRKVSCEKLSANVGWLIVPLPRRTFDFFLYEANQPTPETDLLKLELFPLGKTRHFSKRHTPLLSYFLFLRFHGLSANCASHEMCAHYTSLPTRYCNLREMNVCYDMLGLCIS